MKLLYLLVLPLVSAGTCNDANCGNDDLGRICTDLSGGGYTCACDATEGFWGSTKTNEPALCGFIRCDDADGDGTTGDAVAAVMRTAITATLQATPALASQGSQDQTPSTWQQHVSRHVPWRSVEAMRFVRIQVIRVTPARATRGSQETRL